MPSSRVVYVILIMLTSGLACSCFAIGSYFFAGLDAGNVLVCSIMLSKS